MQRYRENIVMYADFCLSFGFNFVNVKRNDISAVCCDPIGSSRRAFVCDTFFEKIYSSFKTK